jgi:hypothetical protein
MYCSNWNLELVWKRSSTLDLSLLKMARWPSRGLGSTPAVLVNKEVVRDLRQWQWGDSSIVVPGTLSRPIMMSKACQQVRAQ